MRLTKSIFWILRKILFLALCIVPSMNQVSYAQQQTEPLPAETGQIAFVNFGMNGDIFVANADGSNVCHLTYSDDYENFPMWSPDGTQIAFSSRYRGVFVMNSDGSNLRRLGSGGAPKWSVDGSRIGFLKYEKRTYTFFIANRNGENIQQLTDETEQQKLLGLSSSPPMPPNDKDFSYGLWSPNGSQIVIASIENDNWDLYIIDADGKNLRNLTEAFPKDGMYDSHRYNTNPVWSPEGSHIAFDSDQNRNFGIYIMNADGSNMRELIPNARSAAWSPIGTPPRALMATISAPNKINVRSAPSAKSAIVDSVAPVKNRCMVVIGRSEDNAWVKIRNPFSKIETGWVNASLLEVRGDLLSVPILAE